MHSEGATKLGFETSLGRRARDRIKDTLPGMPNLRGCKLKRKESCRAGGRKGTRKELDAGGGENVGRPTI